MRIFHRLFKNDSRLWSDVKIVGVAAGLNRYLLALIPVVIVFPIAFDWKTRHEPFFTLLATYKSVVDIICTTILILAISSLLIISFLGRSKAKKAT